MSSTPLRYDVIVVGAGPVGLTIANFAGLHGLRVLVLEKLPSLIDYPRGVGMDDECLRAFQAIGLAEAIVPHTTPNQWMQFQTAKRRTFASIEPRAQPFGWPKRNAFIQPLVDSILLEGLKRFDTVEVRLGHEMTDFVDQGDDGVTVRCTTADGAGVTFTASHLVAADGGRSAVRKGLGVAFEGETEATHWLVVDIRNDPAGTPDAVLICDPDRPYVSIALPHGIRRFEFMVMKGEDEAELNTPAGVARLLSKFLPDPTAIDLIRSRIYTHNSRLAARLVVGRVALVGDAAHLMPVWQGQGYNSGIRDAANLAWKLVAICKGLARPELLDTYHEERHDHARAMIAISTLAGRIFSPTRRWLAALRDLAFGAMTLIPPVRDYVLRMGFKPMPRYDRGVVVLAPPDPAVTDTPVGRLFVQPRVEIEPGRSLRLDDVLGPWFAIVAFGADPGLYMDEEARALWARLGGRIVVAVPSVQLAAPGIATLEGTRIVGDVEMGVKEWFKGRSHGVVFLRPDRFVAATCPPQKISETLKAVAARIHYTGPTP